MACNLCFVVKNEGVLKVTGSRVHFKSGSVLKTVLDKNIETTLFGCHGNVPDKLENKVQIHHLHVKRFHMVKILRKSVQYVRRYSTKYACFFGRVVPDVLK